MAGLQGVLSPSRAADFMSCPLKYRFRVIDRLPERPSPAAARGTVVHAVLERLYGVLFGLGALVFLAGWWGNHFWRSRRARKRATLAP